MNSPRLYVNIHFEYNHFACSLSIIMKAVVFRSNKHEKCRRFLSENLDSSQKRENIEKIMLHDHVSRLHGGGSLMNLTDMPPPASSSQRSTNPYLQEHQPPGNKTSVLSQGIGVRKGEGRGRLERYYVLYFQ